jgi:hypothetical protein
MILFLNHPSTGITALCHFPQFTKYSTKGKTIKIQKDCLFPRVKEEQVVYKNHAEVGFLGCLIGLCISENP